MYEYTIDLRVRVVVRSRTGDPRLVHKDRDVEEARMPADVMDVALDALQAGRGTTVDYKCVDVRNV